jgi:hypothetical protein
MSEGRTRVVPEEVTRTLPTRGAGAVDRIGKLGWLGLIQWPTAAVLGFLVLIARRPESLTAPAFWNEDGPVFYADPNPLAAYNGYLHLVPRVVALLEHAVPWPALLGNTIALAITVAVALFVASDRLEPVFGRARWFAAGLVLVQPALAELLGSITYAQWWLGLYLLLGAVARAPAGKWRNVDAACLAIASLTGPFSIFAAPLYWLRRDLRPSALLVTAGAAVQLAVFALSPRLGLIHVPDRLPEILLTRGVAESFVGPDLVERVPVFAVAGFAVVAFYLLRHLPARLVLAVAAIAATSLVLSRETTAELLSLYGAQRYFFLPGLVLGWAALVGLSRRDWFAVVPVGLLLVGVMVDFRLAPH